MKSKVSFIIGIVIIIIAVSVFIKTEQKQESSIKTNSVNVNNGINAEKDNIDIKIIKDEYLQLKNQQNSKFVVIEQLFVDGAGYVVIHKKIDGKPAMVVGNSGLVSGGVKNLRIELEDKLESGETYFAMLHKDDGDGKYEFPGDDKPAKYMDKIIMSEFKAFDMEEKEDGLEDKNSVSTEVKNIDIVSGNLFFSPNRLKLIKGQNVKINFKNKGIHTFTIDELGVNVMLTGNTGSVEFTPNKSGKFEYYCAIPGHREGGMVGDLEVIEI